MKKMEWMVAAGAVAALAGAMYSAGCVNTTSDCALLGTCGEGGGTSSGATTTTTGSTSSAGGSSTTTTTTSSSASGTGGAMPTVTVCESKRFGDMKDQAAKTIHVDTSGDMLIAGDYQGTLNLGGKSVTAPGLSTEVFVARVDASWQALPLQSFAVPYGAVANDPSDPSGKGGVVLAGSYVNTADLGCGPLDNTTDLYVAKLDNAGKCLWTKGFAAPGAHVSLAVDSKGNIALAGDSMGPMTFTPGSVVTAGGRDIFIVELDANGNVLTATTHGGTQDDEANAVTFDGNGGMIVTGTFKSPQIDLGTGNLLKNSTPNPHAFAARSGGTGSSWSVGFAGIGEQRPTAVTVEGSVAFIAGDFTDTMGTLKSAGRAFFLVGLDAAKGTTISGKAFDGTGAKTIRSLAGSGGGLLAVTGTIDGDVDFGTGKLTSSGGAVIATIEAGAMGQVRWSQVFGAASSAPLANGAGFLGANLFVAGAFATTLDLGNGMAVDSAGGSDVFVAKLCLP